MDMTTQIPQTAEEWLEKENRQSGNNLSTQIYYRKYCYEKESFPEFLDRVSGGNPDLKKLIAEKKFLPAGRILAGRGLPKDVKVSYSNCYVSPAPEDCLESIFDTAKEMARTYSYGGGCGLDLGKLAPAGAAVRNAAKTTTGAISFIDLYAEVTKLIGQKGRRGAMMISLPCDHPDLPEFIELKTDLEEANSANLSVRVTDAFMKAVEENKDWTMSFTREATGETITRTMPARELFHRLALANWTCGEPGMLFWDTIENGHLLSEVSKDIFRYGGTNPCGEEPLPENGSCLLGSLNLAAFVEDSFQENARINTEKLRDAVSTAVIGLNQILKEGIFRHPIAGQREVANQFQQIGLGIMGFADMLIRLRVRFGSEESIHYADYLGKIIAQQAVFTSASLAGKEGAFPAMVENPNVREAVLNSPWYKNNIVKDGVTDKIVRVHGLANSQLLTIAPTGTLSTMLGISGGIEPVFALSYTRKTETLHGETKFYEVKTPILQDYLEITGAKETDPLPDYFVCARDIPYEERIAVQAAWQRHIDASISSTCNLPESASVEDVDVLLSREVFPYKYLKVPVHRDRKTPVLLR